MKVDPCMPQALKLLPSEKLPAARAVAHRWQQPAERTSLAHLVEVWIHCLGTFDAQMKL